MPVASRFPASSMMPILTPVPGPTEPGLRSAGGCGFDDIWCEASVIPYASRTGTPNTRSICAIISAGSDALQDRMNLHPSAPGAGSSPARESRRLGMVGTAEYHVALVSRTVRLNESGLNLLGSTTVPADSSVEKA